MGSFEKVENSMQATAEKILVNPQGNLKIFPWTQTVTIPLGA